MNLNKKLLLSCAFGVILTIAGVVGNNTLEQLRPPSEKADKTIRVTSRLLFVVGLFLIAHAISSGRNASTQLVVWTSILIVITSVYLMKRSTRKREPVCVVYPAAFAIAWLVIGIIATSQLIGIAKLIGPLAAVCLVLAVLLALPAQRRNCVVDGPGMPLFVLALCILTITNASRY